MLFSERVVSACVGSVAVTFLMTPLDVVKVRMQAAPQAHLCEVILFLFSFLFFFFFFFSFFFSFLYIYLYIYIFIFPFFFFPA